MSDNLYPQDINPDTALLASANAYTDSEIAALPKPFIPSTVWDASAGTFPSGDLKGYTHKVSVAGTVDGVAFALTDLLVAEIDAPSTTVFTGNWQKWDVTDTELGAQINAAPNKVTPVAADKIAIWDSVSGLLQSVYFTAIKTFFGIGAGESSTLFLNRQGNWVTTPAAGVLNDYLEQAFTAQTSVTVVHNFGAKPVPLVIVGVAKAEPLNILYTENDETTLSDNQFIVKFANPTTGLIVASVGAPPLMGTIAVSDNYTMLMINSYIEVTVPEKTIALLTAVGIDGKQLTIDNSSNGVIYVDAAGSETIQGELIQTIPAQSSITIRSNGANWRVI